MATKNSFLFVSLLSVFIVENSAWPVHRRQDISTQAQPLNITDQDPGIVSDQTPLPATSYPMDPQQDPFVSTNTTSGIIAEGYYCQTGPVWRACSQDLSGYFECDWENKVML